MKQVIEVCRLYIQNLPVSSVLSADRAAELLFVCHSVMNSEFHRHRQPILRLHCQFPGCPKVCKTQSGLTKHVHDMHTCANRVQDASLVINEGPHPENDTINDHPMSPHPTLDPLDPPSPTAATFLEDHPTLLQDIQSKEKERRVHPHLNGMLHL